MRVVVAPDSFKECLSAPQVAAALAAGWSAARPGDEVRCVPMADGGEGTAEALIAATGGTRVQCRVTGPLGEPVHAAFGLSPDGRTAYIEMAAASGLHLVPLDRRDPRITTTFGTGELIRHALDRGARHIVIGIGGSATNDGGAGMAQALGFRLRNASGQELAPGGIALGQLAAIDASGVHPALKDAHIEAASDVDNPLCGPKGASHVYGPQKGAAGPSVVLLDTALAHFANVLRRDLGADVAHVPGAGAAGGLGAGLMAFCGAALRPGIGLVADACGLADALAGAGLVLTGEGRLDGQSIHGKVPVGVARLAREAGVPVVALCGTLGPGWHAVYEHGIDAVFPIAPGPVPLAEALRNAPENLERTAHNIARVWQMR